MAIRERLIQLTLRAKDFLSRDIQPASDALKELTAEGNRLKASLNDASRARTLARTLRDNEQATAGLRQAWQDAQATLDDLTREIGDNETATAGQRIALREARRTAEEAERAYQRNQSAIKNTTTELKRLGVDTRNIAAEEQRLAGELAQAKDAANANREAIRQLRAEEKAAAEAARLHAERVEAVESAMAGGVRRVLAFAAAFVSLDAAFGLARAGLLKVRDGIYAFLQTGDKYELLDKQLASLMGSIAAGEQAVAWIKDFAKNTPLEVAEVTEAFALLKSYGLDPMDGTLQAIVDQNEKLGGGMERLNGIASALGQAYAKQKLQTEEILQLVERGVPVWSMLEKVTGKNAAQLQDLATKGKLGRDVIQALVVEIGKSADGAAASAMGTLTGLVSNLSDMWSGFLNRIASSGALEYAKGRLKALADTIDEMDRDGRLDRLAKSLSDAFIQGGEKLEEFGRKLVKLDFNKLVDDSSAWLSQFGSNIDKTVSRIELLTAPIRLAGNVLTTFMAGVGTFAASIADGALMAVSITAKAIPEALGGKALREGLSNAREAVREFRSDLVGQIQQDGSDLASIWKGVSGAATQSGEDQASAAAKVTDAVEATGEAAAASAEASKRSAEGAAKDVRTATDALIGLIAEGKVGLGGLSQALDLISTAKSREQLEQLRKALLDAYRDGKLSQDEYTNATGVLSGRFKELGRSAGGAADLVSDLEEKLGDLTSVQAAISNAKTDVDINAIRTALRKLYGDGEITARQYNEELKKTSDRQKELKAATDAGKKSQDAKNASDREAIRTSEDLRRESGRRMEAERQAGDQAMQDRRRGAEEAQRDMSAVEDFFGGVMTRAREPLAQLSEAALAAYDKLQGITTVDLALDTSGLEATTLSLRRATEALGQMEAAASTVGLSDLGRFMTQSLVRSQRLQVQYLEEKRALQQLLEGYEEGSISARNFAQQAEQTRSSVRLLNDSDLRTLESAIDSARQRMQQLGESSQQTLNSLRDELDQLQGNQDDIERRRFASRRRELESQMEEARQSGDPQALANLQRSLGLLRQIEAETAAQSERAAQQRRAEEVAKAAQAQAPQPVGSTPAKVIRLEGQRGRGVDVQVVGGSDADLLGVLEDAGMRSI